MSHGDGLVSLPLVVRVDIVNEDDEVIVAALVVALGLDGFAASHLDGLWSCAKSRDALGYSIDGCLVLGYRENGVGVDGTAHTEWKKVELRNGMEKREIGRQQHAFIELKAC